VKNTNSLLPDRQNKRGPLLQLLFVALAFTLMVVASGLYVHNMMRENLRRDATDLLVQAKLIIEAEILEPQSVLIPISETIRGMIMKGDSVDDVYGIMKRIGRELKNKQKGFTYDSLNGYFDIFGGIFLMDAEIDLPEDYNPADQLWYKTAIEAGDRITVTPIYNNILFNDYLLTYVRRIFGDNGEPLGIICLDVPLNRITESVADMRLTKSSYGILHTENLDIIHHPDPDIIGKNAVDVDSGIAQFANRVLAGENLDEDETKNYTGDRTLLFSIRLDNGWIIYNVIPKAEYFRELRDMELMLGVLGLIMATALGLVLINIDNAKNRADRESRQKSIQLEAMEKIREADEYAQLMLDTTPLGANFWDKEGNIIACNAEAVRLFSLENKQEYVEKFYELSPEYQPDGKQSTELAKEKIKSVYRDGFARFEWLHRNLKGELIPCAITLVRIKYKGDYLVAGFTRDLREYKQMMLKIEQRDKLLKTVNHAAVVMLATKDEHTQTSLAAIQEGLGLLGRSVDVDRVQIWQNEMINGTLYFVHKYEWLSDTGQQYATVPIGLKISYSDKPEWEKKFLRDECINSPLRDLPQSDQDLLKPFNIKSIVIIPLFLHDRFWGFFSLDDCRSERIFSPDEMSILRSGGLLIANAFIRNDMMENIHSGSALLEEALKEAQEANAAKSKFLATMSHEIRTPMNVILGITESYISNEAYPQEIKEAFEKIYNSGDLLLHIINDILDLSKIEAGKFELSSVKYEVLSLINDTATLNIMQYSSKQLDFILNISENLPEYMIGDELRIKQILNNLISNSFKYTNDGQVELYFAVENTAGTDTTLVIRVSDTGQGMTHDQINKLFDEYSRFNLEANRTTVGTGLGMAITNNLIKMMGGEMRVESTPGMGSAFTVRIPQGIAGSGILGRETVENLRKFNFTDKIRKEKTKISRELMPYGRVLIVDDMKSNLDVAKLLLQPYQLQIETAGSGAETIKKINNGEVYDIIFMDHMMPNMDGIETMKNLRSLGYKNPVLALTANAVTGQQEMFLANGFDGFISKPIDLRQLNESLNRFIRDKERRRKNNQENADRNDIPQNESSQSGSDINPDKLAESVAIYGIDPKAGLTLYDFDMEIYISVLRSFVPNALSNIEKLSTVTEETLREYAVNVHGMKGIGANIGARTLSETALKLETLANSGDLAAILAGNGEFLKEAEKVVSGVQDWLKKHDEKNEKPLLETPDRALLAGLYRYCSSYDMKNIDIIMDKLEGANYKNDALLINWLREKINASDFSSAAERLQEYREET